MKKLFHTHWHHLDENQRALRIVQPFLIGLTDGALSTLAPIFALAVSVGSHAALIAGLAAAIGASLSMGIAEFLADSGEFTGRGPALVRGIVIAVGTLIGGIIHTLPFLINDTQLALLVAYPLVLFELVWISLIRRKYQKVKFMISFVQVVVAGVLIVACGIALGTVG